MANIYNLCMHHKLLLWLISSQHILFQFMKQVL